jgi:hypothetical protein
LTIIWQWPSSEGVAERALVGIVGAFGVRDMPMCLAGHAAVTVSKKCQLKIKKKLDTLRRQTELLCRLSVRVPGARAIVAHSEKRIPCVRLAQTKPIAVNPTVSELAAVVGRSKPAV